MGYVKNSKGCEINASFHKKSDFFSLAMLHQEREDFKEAINHRLVDITFWHGREICISICGTRKLKVPKSCQNLKQVAEWINSKDF